MTDVASITVGFFTSSYILFSSSFTLPMLGYVYWYHTENTSYVAAFNNATVAGCIVGMILFGVLADTLGRRKMYGWELIVLMVGTMGVVMSSAGYIPVQSGNSLDPASINYESYGSMNIQSWLLFWRFVSGVGIGGEFPLSAVIASEYAPTSSRPRILATVFAMRVLSIAAGALVALIATHLVSLRHPYDTSDPQASARAVDQIWRWVTGFGLVPAAVTAVIRFTVPESPRYTLDVLNDPIKASEETCRWKGTEGELQSQNAPHVTSMSYGALKDEEDGIQRFVNDTEADEDAQRLTIKNYFWREGNWRTLLATSLSWFLVDLSLFADGLNESKTLGKFWFGSLVPSDSGAVKPYPWNSTPDPTMDIFSILMGNSYHLLAIESIASIIGSLLLIIFINRINRKMLTWVMFLVNGALFIIMGATLATSGSRTQIVGIDTALFALAKLCKLFGPGPLTFILPAELFPTKWRATCHAISAASGKLGAVLAAIILHYGTFGRGHTFQSTLTWLGYVYMIFAAPLFLAAGVSWLWIPELQEPNGKNKTLEQLAEGRNPHRRHDMVVSTSST